MSNRAATPESDALAAWRKATDTSINALQQRPIGAGNGLIVPGGAAGTWLAMTLTSPWVAGTLAPAYTMDADGFVHLRGTVVLPTAWAGTIWLPPAGYAPRVEELAPCAANAASVGSAIVDVHPTLGVSFVGASVAWANAASYVSLSGIRFYAGAQ